MPKRKRIQREHTEDWQTIQQYTLWPEQTAYELLRPLVLFGDPAGKRVQETGTAESTLDRKAEYRAARLHAHGTTRVRALAFLRDTTREFCWVQEAIHQITDTGEGHPATAGDLDLLARAIAYGWFLVYLQASVGQEARVLHQVGVRVPARSFGPGDLPRLLQEHTIPQTGAAIPLQAAPGSAEVAEREGAPVPSSLFSLQNQPTAGPPSVNPCQERRPGKTRRFPVRFVVIADGALLLLGSILAATRNPWYGFGTLALLVVLVLTLRFSRRARMQASSERAQQQAPSANH